MAGNIYSDGSVPSTVDKFKYCRAGQHLLKPYRADGSTKVCTVCHGEWNDEGEQIGWGELAETTGTTGTRTALKHAPALEPKGAKRR